MIKQQAKFKRPNQTEDTKADKLRISQTDLKTKAAMVFPYTLEEQILLESDLRR